MINELLEKTKKVLEDWGEEPERRPQRPMPTTIPGAPPREPRRKPKNPLVPTPGKDPKPKASSNPDVELFKKVRTGVNEMAFDPGKFPDFVDPQRKDWIETGDEELDKILPKLSGGEQSYLEMITSETYQEMIARLEKYTQMDAEDIQIPQLIGLTIQSIEKVKEIESGHIEELKKMALETVLNFPEFKMVKDAYENGDLGFDIQFKSSDVDFMPEIEPDEDDLSDAEKLNLQMADAFEEVNELDLEHRLANLLIQGNATLKTYLFNIVNKELTAIDPALPSLYGILAVVSQFGYWFMPPGFEEMANAGELKNSEKVDPEDDGYIIRVQAFAFPYVIHELVKGIYEWISITEETGKSASVDTLAKESEDMIVGPALTKILASYIPHRQQELMPLIHKKLIKLSRDDVKDIFLKSKRGQQIMSNLIKTSANEWEQYRDEQREADVEEMGL